MIGNLKMKRDDIMILMNKYEHSSANYKKLRNK